MVWGVRTGAPVSDSLKNLSRLARLGASVLRLTPTRASTERVVAGKVTSARMGWNPEVSSPNVHRSVTAVPVRIEAMAPCRVARRQRNAARSAGVIDVP